MRKEHQVKQEETNFRLDKLLTILEPTHSRQQIQQWIKAGLVVVDEQRVKANYKCKAKQHIRWTVPEEETYSIEAEPIELDIIYEDDYLLVVNKPKGMLVHPTKQVNTGTLVHALKYHCQTLSDRSGEQRPGIVHRLDKETSGLLVVAKDNTTHEYLQNQFMEQTVTRMYEAIVEGVIGPNHGIIQAPIGRNPSNRLQRTVIEGGRPAETTFDVLQRFQHHTHVQCGLITGRTHQIRVHMDYMNHPIVGDELYNRKRSALAHSQALFSRTLQFIHPHTKEQVTYTINQPTYFHTLLQKLERMS